MRNVEILHNELKDFCIDNTPDKNQQLGFAIHKSFILELYKKSLQNFLNLNIQNRFIQSQSPIGNHALSFELDIDYRGTNLILSYNVKTGHNEADLKGLNLTLKILATDITNNTSVGIISTTSIKYSYLKSYFALDNHDLKLIPISYKLLKVPVTVPSANKNNILALMGITNKDYDIKEQAIIMIAIEELSRGFIDAISFPDFYNMLVGFKLNEGGKLGNDSTYTYFFFSTGGIINTQQCSVKKANNELQVSASVSSQTTNNQNSNIITAKVQADNSVWDNYENQISRNSDEARDSQLYIFIPTISYKIPFETIVKPSVNFSDRGSLGPIYYRWTSSSALKSLGIEISSVSGNPSILISAPNWVEGQAGAGIKIGCIRYEAAGAMFDGEVDPLTIEFTISIDLNVPSIIFISKIKEVRGKNFSFRTFPTLEFPLSEILDFLLARASETIITKQASNILNVTRITLADFSIFRDISGIANNLAYFQDNDGNLTAGVEFRI